MNRHGLVLAEVGTAHNWINSPRSRTAKLSQTNQCPPRQRFNYPDIQVNRGQPFTLEWQVGHPRSYNFFVLVAAEDEDKLPSHTEAMMWDYLNSAPSNATRYEGAYWDKYHVGYLGTGGASSNTDYVNQGRTLLAADDPVAPKRPWAFECPYGTVVDPDRSVENPGCPEGRTGPTRCNSGPTGISQCGSSSGSVSTTLASRCRC